MPIWDQLVDLLRTAIVAGAQACGGNVGAGIAGVSLVVRMAVFPLTLRLARLSAAHERLMRKVRPELDRLREKYRSRPERLAEEMRRVFAREGASPAPLAGCVGTLGQFPLLLGLFSAVRACAAAGGRFLWIRNIARPDVFLAIAVTALTSATLALGSNPAQPGRMLMLLVSAAITLWVLSRMAAGIGLYWGVSSLVSLLQAAILRRETLRAGTV